MLACVDANSILGEAMLLCDEEGQNVHVTYITPGLALGTEAPFMTPSGVHFSFLYTGYNV